MKLSNLNRVNQLRTRRRELRAIISYTPESGEKMQVGFGWHVGLELPESLVDQIQIAAKEDIVTVEAELVALGVEIDREPDEDDDESEDDSVPQAA